MSEQRFIIVEMPYDDFIINDTVEDKEVYNNGVVNLLNNQDAIIKKQDSKLVWITGLNVLLAIIIIFQGVYL